MNTNVFNCFLLSLIFLFAQCASLKNATSGTFKDKRDGQTYKWLRLKDGKKWIVQNLNYEMADSWCYDDMDSNCAKYGRLYNWEAAMKACPEGWRLPSDDEWWAMASHYGKAYNFRRGQETNEGDAAGKAAYKALIQEGDSGFSVLLGGRLYSDGSFYDLGDRGYYWSSSEQSSSRAWYYGFYIGSEYLFRHHDGKSVGRSCRCLQD